MGAVKRESVAAEGRGRVLRAYDDKLVYSVPEAAKKLGVSRNFGYELARTKQIPIIRFGKRMLVPKAAFHKMLGVSEEEAGK